MEHAEVQSSFLEYQGFFEEPIFEAWERPHSVLGAVFRALRQWNITLDKVSQRKDQPNLGADELEFHLLNSRLIFKVGLGGILLSLTNPVWPDKDTVIAQAEAALDAVQKSTGAVTQRQLTTMGLHLRPTARTPLQITERFLDMTAVKSGFGDVQGTGFSVYQNDVYWIVDQSWLYPGAIFLKTQRAYTARESLKVIADKLQADETKLLLALELAVQ